MIRKCDGTDPNLIYYAPCTREDCPTTQTMPEIGHAHRVPCNCGKRFDDVKHLTVYPHTEF